MQKPTILVLLDLKENSELLLEAGASLAKAVNGRLQALHIRTPLEAIEQENQLSAKKEFYQHYQSTKEQLEPMIERVSSQVELSIDYSLIYGNVSNQIKGVIEQKQPDFTVLGKRKSKLGGLLGDRITNTVLNIAKNTIYIVNPSEVLKNFEGITVGVLNDSRELSGMFSKSIVKKEGNKVNYFTIGKGDEEESALKKSEGVFYVFPETSGAVNNMASYITKTNSQIFCIPKTALREKESFAKKLIPKLTTNVLLA
jgi:nucleotide-binding universal stress UspA family protein